MGILLSISLGSHCIIVKLIYNHINWKVSVSVYDWRRRGYNMENIMNDEIRSLEEIIEMFGSLNNSLGYLNTPNR